MQPFKKGLMAIVALIAITSAAAGIHRKPGADRRRGTPRREAVFRWACDRDSRTGPEKGFDRLPGRLSVSLNLAAAEREPSVGQASQPVDLLVVLDPQADR